MPKSLFYLSISLVNCQPVVDDELKLFVGLDVPDDDGCDEPGGVVLPPGVVMPHS